MAIAKTSIAINSGYGDKKRTDYFNIVAFGKTAELFEKYVTKGMALCLRCHAQNNNWTDKDGNKRYDIQFIVDEVDFCGSKKDEQPKPSNDDFVSVPDGVEEELPFS